MHGMTSPLDLVIERNRIALLTIIAALISMIGTDSSRVAHSIRLTILRILRPAESAVRRLIAATARNIEVEWKPSRPMPKDIAWTGKRNASTQKSPQFKLTDPRPSMRIFHTIERGDAARISVIEPMAPTITAIWAAQHSAYLAAQRAAIRAANTVKPTQPMTLADRLAVVKNALENLPHQAKRLLRWQARRERVAEKQPTYTSPLRPGRPPGHRSAPDHEVTKILHDCQWIAHEARLNSS
jgi:hypothetical protein